MTVIFLEVSTCIAEKWVTETKGLSVNFSNVTYISVLHSYFAGHALSTKNLNQATRYLPLGGLGWLGIRLFTALIRNTCMFLIISALYTRITQLYGDLRRQCINTLTKIKLREN